MGELVVLQFGDHANTVGSYFWNLQFEQLNWSKVNSDKVQLNHTCLLNETSSGSFFPRCVVCDNTGGFGMINPQTGCHSPSFIETKKVKNIFNDYANDGKIKCIEQDHESMSILQKHWSYPYQYSFSPRSIYEMYNNHNQVNPIDSITACQAAFQSSVVFEDFTERIRYQLEQCDNVSGIVLMEDVMHGWDGVSVVKDYLVEEGICHLYSIGVGSQSQSNQVFNQTLCVLNALSKSSLFSYCDQSPCLFACCLDSFLAPFGFDIEIMNSCRQLERNVHFSQLVNQFSLGERNTILGMEYSTKILPQEKHDEREMIKNEVPIMNWKPLYSSSLNSTDSNFKEKMPHLENRNHAISIISRLHQMDIEKQLFCCNFKYYQNTLYHNIIISDPIILPLSSFNQLKQEDTSFCQNYQWYSLKQNEIYPNSMVWNHSINEVMIHMAIRASNENKCLDSIAEPLRCISVDEKNLRYWLKRKCNESNELNELNLMEMVDDCIDVKDQIYHDYHDL